jgi:hypothetical protein
MNISNMNSSYSSENHGMNFSPQMSSISTVLENAEAIELDLVSRAQDLANEVHDLLRVDFKDRKTRRPPLTLSCRLRKDRYGPILVWVRYSIRERVGKNTVQTRYTEEVKGRRYHTYPNAIFKGLRDQDLILKMVEIESRAAKLRRETSDWTAMLTAAKQIKKQMEDEL